MRLAPIVAACVAAALIGATFASVCYAYQPSTEFDGPVVSPVYQPLTGVNAPGYVSPLLAKEIAAYTNEGIPISRAIQDIELQSKVGETELPGKLQTAMGKAYAGVWFENETAHLNIGITTAAAQMEAERVVASVGLTDSVEFTLVRSTSAELIAAQNRWDRKLGSLPTREEFATALEPQHNAVRVTLSQSMPPSQRATLEHEAATDDVKVTVVTKHIGIRSARGECNQFSLEEENANCNPSITSGVRIWSKIKCNPVANQVGPQFYTTKAACEERRAKGEKGEWERVTFACTAGPLAYPLAKRLERVVLTAGHCIQRADNEWVAFTRSASEELIGSAEGFTYGGFRGEKNGDYGDIRIESGGGWQTGNPLKPILAVTAQWEKLEESRYPVKGMQLSVINAIDCHEGATIGEWCGKTFLLDERYSTEAGDSVEGASVDSRMITEPGDSGGPVLSVNMANEIMMEGTMSAIGQLECIEIGVPQGEYFNTEAECLKPREFKNGKKGKWERYQIEFWQPLRPPEVMGETSPGSLEGLKLELLTEANEAQPQFLQAEWLVGGTAVASELAIQTSGELLLEDAKALGGKLAVLCSGTLDGWVSSKGLGKVNELLNLSGETISSTPLSGLALECTSQTGCETGMAAKVWPVGLGWETEASLYEEPGGSYFALLFLPHSGGGKPGWEIECLVLGTTVTDECTASENVSELALEGTKLLEKLSVAFAELTEIKLLSCSLGGTESGAVEGESSITLNEGGELTASSEGSVA